MAKLIIAFGVLITWSYCAFTINFFPTGLNIADSLVFIFIALGFGLLYLYWLACGFLVIHSGYCIRKEPAPGDKVFYACMCLALFACLAAIAFIMRSWPALLAPLASGFILSLATFHWPQQPAGNPVDETRRRRLRLSMIMAAIAVPPFLAAPVLGKIIDGAFGFIGIQQRNVSLVLSTENQNTVSDVAKEFGLPLYGCSSSVNKTNIAHHFNVLWHGLGERSLVELLVFENNRWQPKAKIELDRAGLKVLTPLGDHTTFNTCLTLSTDTLFDTYSDMPTEDGKQQLKAFAESTRKKLDDAKLQILSASITGHTDRTPIARTDDSNFKLSRRRADQVFIELTALFEGIPAAQVERLGRGSLTPKSNCPWELKGAQLRECVAVDRRVEIELKLQPK